MKANLKISIFAGFCTDQQWQCADGDCIDYQMMCDGEIDCDDESDENPTCSNFRIR